MKTTRLILFSFTVFILVAWAGNAVAANFVNLIPNTEKWFRSEGDGALPTLRLHTAVSPNLGLGVVMHRELLQGDTVLDSEFWIFDHDLEGNIYYYGQAPSDEFAQPILWVDAPLAVGKTWTDSRPASGGALNATGDLDPLGQVFYIFAVLEHRPVTCPAGTFDCYRVFTTEIYPDGTTKNTCFWYNAECGMVMCTFNSKRTFKLVKSWVNEVDDGGYEMDNPVGGLFGGLKSSPNPFNPKTNIAFELKNPARVEVGIFDVSGRLVKTLVNGDYMDAGPVSLTWQGTDEAGQAVASGSYIFRVQAGNTAQTGQVTLIR